MVKHKLKTKRTKQKKHTYFGEYHAKALLNWLYDRATNQKDRKVVLELIELGRAYQDSTDRYVREGLKGKVNTILATMADLNFYPVVVDMGGIVKWEVEKFGGLADAIRSWLELVSRGLLGRLKQCARKNCGKWLFAKFTHAAFCSLECRDAAAREDPGRHERRKEYERRYYHDVLAGGKKT